MAHVLTPLNCCRTAEMADPRHPFHVVPLGAATVWSATLRSSPSPSPAPLVSPTTPPCVGRLHLLLPLEGEITVGPAGGQALLTAHDLYLDDCSHPADPRSGPVTLIGADIPEAMLPRPRDAAPFPLGRHAAHSHAAATVLTRFLAQVVDESRAYRPVDGPRLGAVLCGMVAALHDPVPGPDTVRHRLTARITAFIQQHVADPGLPPRSVAAAHGISLSYLHRLFRNERETVAALIRRHRLERARFDLADPAQSSAPVQEVAARWGFVRATDFARSFRAAYGVAPSAYRRSADGAR